MPIVVSTEHSRSSLSAAHLCFSYLTKLAVIKVYRILGITIVPNSSDSRKGEKGTPNEHSAPKQHQTQDLVPRNYTTANELVQHSEDRQYEEKATESSQHACSSQGASGNHVVLPPQQQRFRVKCCRQFLWTFG